MWRAFEKAGYAATNKIRPPKLKRKSNKISSRTRPTRPKAKPKKSVQKSRRKQTRHRLR
jgi:hypothetical protein